jgi:SAM-dependent methyltransferase
MRTKKERFQMPEPTVLQRSYYEATASKYDALHDKDPAHTFALAFLVSMIDHYQIRSLLDVGAGTGRVGLFLQAARPQISVIGIEPISALRESGHSKGASRSSLIEGNAHAIPFQDKSFDMVCAFGVMHHLADPTQATIEMLRVARLAIFISDHNDYGRGTASTTLLKQTAKAVGLWSLYKFLITRGRGYRITDDDGLWYPYSIFDTYKVIRPHCASIHFLNTLNSEPNLYRKASHVAMIGRLR